MKRMILLAVGLAIGAATATAQNVAMYSEVYKEKTGALEYKQWVSAGGSIRQETPDGKVTIMRIDSMKMYNLDPAAKTAQVLPLSQENAAKHMAGRQRELQLIKDGVDVEGYATSHYKVSDVHPGQNDGVNERQEWIHAPFNTWIRILWDPLLGPSVRRNIRPGAQPASLFEIPRDYTVSSMIPDGLQELLKGKQNGQTDGAGALLEMMTGGKGTSGTNNADEQKKQEAMQMILQGLGGAK